MNIPGLLFDECDRALVESQPWSLARGYVWGNVPGKRGRSHYLARLIMNAPPHLQVDHINHDKLDNRRCNLRLVTPAQNAANKRAQANSKSGERGVSWDRFRSMWMAQAKVEGRRVRRRFEEFGDAVNFIKEWRLANMPGATS